MLVERLQVGVSPRDGFPHFLWPIGSGQFTPPTCIGGIADADPQFGCRLDVSAKGAQVSSWTFCASPVGI